MDWESWDDYQWRRFCQTVDFKWDQYSLRVYAHTASGFKFRGKNLNCGKTVHAETCALLYDTLFQGTRNKKNPSNGNAISGEYIHDEAWANCFKDWKWVRTLRLLPAFYYKANEKDDKGRKVDKDQKVFKEHMLIDDKYI